MPVIPTHNQVFLWHMNARITNNTVNTETYAAANGVTASKEKAIFYAKTHKKTIKHRSTQQILNKRNDFRYE